MSELATLDTSSAAGLQALAVAPAELLDAIPAAICVVDANGRIVRHNAHAAAIWGRTPRLNDDTDLYCGSLATFRADGAPLSLADAPMGQALRTGRPVRDAQVAIARPDGGRAHLLVNIEPLIGDDGQLAGAINCFQDISERVRAERQLERSRQDLEDFFQNGAVGLHLVSATGTILRANQAELDMLGYQAHEYIGRSIREFHADPHVIADILRRLAAGEKLDKYPARLIAKDGSVRHVLITSNVHFRDGEFLNTRCFTVDVTGWRNVEAARAETERRLAVTHEAAPVGIVETDAEGRFLRTNPALHRITGYTEQELRDLTFNDITHPEDVERDTALYRRQISGELDHYSVEKRYLCKDGGEKHVQVHSASVRDDAGRFLYGVRIIEDITERRLAQARLAESERRARELLNALPVAIYTTDPAGKLTSFNEAAVDFCGRVPELGHDHWCVTWKLYELDGAPLPHERCPMARTLKEGVEVRGAVAIAERPDGLRIPFMPFPKLLRGPRGEVTGAVNMLVDISERMRAEDAQRVLIDELNHRVKNTLATVQSIAAQTMRSTPEAFLERFDARVMALSQAHNLLTRRRWTGVGLRELLDEQLHAHLGDDARLTLEGPDVLLSPRIGLLLGMLVHELATNAAKYGALSVGDGRVGLAWTVDEGQGDRSLRLSWVEEHGPPVMPPARQGFGTRLIERSVLQDLHGDLGLRFERDGVRCEMAFPLA